MTSESPVWTDPDKCCNVSFNKDRKYLCIDYPAIVNNVDKALNTLGGIPAIEKAYCKPNARLALTWRPEDFYAKAAYGDRCDTTNLLMKVKRRRRKDASPTDEYQYCVEILGVIGTSYKFQAMTDIQFLPMVKKDTGQYESLLDKITVSKLEEYKDFFGRDVPLFLPPVLFSRNDLPSEYLFRPGVQHRPMYVDPDESRPANLIGTVRQKRTIYTIFVNFEDDIPTAPLDRAEVELRKRYKNPEWEKKVKQLFDERPVWSKAALAAQFSANSGPSDKLKFLLPLVAYYYLTGPWRCLWVRLGYDPKTDLGAKMYQMLDFRVRQRGAVERLSIQTKRSTFSYTLPLITTRTQANVAKIKPSELGPSTSTGTDTSAGSKEKKSAAYMFLPHHLPPHRQMFYQFCDIMVPEVQKMVSQNDGKEESCSESDGWCMKGINERCREVMYDHVKVIINRQDKFEEQYKTKNLKKKKKVPQQLLEADLSEEDQDLLLDIEENLEEDVNEMETELLDCA